VEARWPALRAMAANPQLEQPPAPALPDGAA